jgi:hypothetical protein
MLLARQGVSSAVFWDQLRLHMLRSLCFAALLCVASTAGADPITFSNDDVNLGSGTVIPLTNEFAALGLSFTNVYRYIDERDSFPEYLTERHRVGSPR